MLISRPLVAAVLVFLASLALAGEPKKGGPKERPLAPAPTEDEVDKPTKTGAPRPQEIPQPAAKEDEEGEDEGEGEAPKAKAHNPFAKRGTLPKYALPARLTPADGKVLEGHVWRSGNAPIRIFNRARRSQEDYKLADLQRIDVKPESETFEQDWRWKEQGSSEMIKLETGYFWNQYLTTFTTHEGEKAAGDCNGQLYLMTLDGKKGTWILWKRQSGRDLPHAKRADLKPLPYIKCVEFTDDFLKKAEEKKE